MHFHHFGVVQLLHNLQLPALILLVDENPLNSEGLVDILLSQLAFINFAERPLTDLVHQ